MAVSVGSKTLQFSMVSGAPRYIDMRVDLPYSNAELSTLAVDCNIVAQTLTGLTNVDIASGFPWREGSSMSFVEVCSWVTANDSIVDELLVIDLDEGRLSLISTGLIS